MPWEFVGVFLNFILILGNWNNCSSVNQAGRKTYSEGIRSNTRENNSACMAQSWSLAAPFYRNNSKKEQGEEEVTVEKHLLQDWQKWVLLLRLPVAPGWLPFFWDLLGDVQQLGAFLGEVFCGRVVHGSLRQLGVYVCKEHIAHGREGLVGDYHGSHCLGHWLPWGSPPSLKGTCSKMHQTHLFSEVIGLLYHAGSFWESCRSVGICAAGATGRRCLTQPWSWAGRCPRRTPLQNDMKTKKALHNRHCFLESVILAVFSCLVGKRGNFWPQQADEA